MVNRLLRTSPRRLGVAVTVAAVLCGGLVGSSAGGAVADSPVCATSVHESAPVFGAARSGSGPTSATVVRRATKVRTVSVRRIGGGRWKARVAARARVSATARRAVVIAVPVQVTASATVTCGAQSVTATRAVPAHPEVQTPLTASADRVHRDRAVRRAETKAGAVRAARAAALRGWRTGARKAAVRELRYVSTDAAWGRARETSYAQASRAAVAEAVSVVETELTATQPR